MAPPPPLLFLLLLPLPLPLLLPLLVLPALLLVPLLALLVVILCLPTLLTQTGQPTNLERPPMTVPKCGILKHLRRLLPTHKCTMALWLTEGPTALRATAKRLLVADL